MDKKFHYVYKITNVLNGKFYVGRRSTNKHPNIDSYMGSGWALKGAYLKHGKKNFIKEVLEMCYDLETLKEREEYWISHTKAVKMGYNLVENSGGGYINKETYDMMSEKFKGRRPETDKIIATKRENGNLGHTGETKAKIKKSVRETYENPEIRKKCAHIGENNPFYGKTHSKKTIELLRRPKSEEHKKNLARLVTCEHCEKEVKLNTYNRWHGDNCKFKKL